MKKLPLPLLVFLFFFQLNVFAQAPAVVSVSPKNMTIADPLNLEIRIEFDQPLDLATVDYSNFKVFGRWTGPRTDIAFSMSDNNQTVTLLLDTENDPFNAGEWVSVNLSKGIRAAGGDNLAKGYSWNFWIATAPGYLSQPKVKVLELRQPGEGLLQAYGAYAGDLNDDDFSDLTVIDETADDLRILLNNGNGDYFTDSMEIFPMGQSSPSPNEGADFNGDGEIDLAVCTAHDNQLRVLFGDGEGHFFKRDDYTTGSNARGLVVMDFNGDGADDIVIANRESSNMTFFTNDGIGQFSAATLDLDPAGFGESGLAAADANNDGIPDLYIGFFHSQQIGIFLGDGAGGFNLSDKVSLGSANKPWMIGVGDFDGDGFADVASANSEGNTMTLHFTDGTGNFIGVAPLATLSNALFPLAIDLGDIDGDGDLDIVTSYYTTANYVVFENEGNGSFIPAAFLPASINASCAILHDRDNDGDLDITGTDEGADHVILFENKLQVAVPELAESLRYFDVSPNPFYDHAKIFFELTEKTEVLLEIHNAGGDLLEKIWSGQLSAGKHEVEFNDQILPGVYFILLKTGDQISSQKVIKME